MDKLMHGGDIYSLSQPHNILDFSTNINPIGIHPDVRKAVIDSVDACIHYPDPLCRELTTGIALWEKVYQENIVCGNGAADIIFRLAQLLKPRRALLPVPTFSEYECALHTVGCEIEYHYLREEDDFQPTESILNAINANLDVVFLCNPNNPTGMLVEPALMIRILEVCRKNDILLVVDECFNGFVDEPDKHSLKQQLGKYKNLFLLKAFTKLFAIPGLRLGYGICSDDDLMSGLRQCGQAWSVSVPAQAAGVAAFNLDGYLECTHALIAEQRKWLKAKLSPMGMQVYRSAANYIFVKCAEKNLKEYLLTKNILIRDCANYQGLTAGYYRFAVLGSQANQKLIQAIECGIHNKEIVL